LLRLSDNEATVVLTLSATVRYLLFAGPREAWPLAMRTQQRAKDWAAAFRPLLDLFRKTP